MRLRHDKTKGNGSKMACLAMVYKLAQTAQRGWRELNGYELISDVIRCVKFVDGDRIKAA